jgi:Tfp pilus assembly protein PilV
MEKYHGKSKGYTLMEVLLVVLVLVLAFFPLLQMLMTGIIVSADAENKNTAVALAQKRLEELKFGTYDSVSNEALTSVTSYPAFFRQVNVTTPDANLKDVKVTISWGGGQKADRITIETFIAR